jgi:AraC-like DNA-binding protein
LKYREFIPSKKLSDYIQLIWILESETPEEKFEREIILPDGIVELVLHYREPFFTYDSEGHKFLQPQGFAISQIQNFIEIESNGAIGFISIRFYPWGAYHFFSEPIGNFLDGTISIEKLWEQDHQIILELLKDSSAKKKVKTVNDFLLSKLFTNDKLRRIDDALKLIRDTKGLLTVDELSDRMNMSYKQPERNFLATVGTTPKIFSRNTRFLHLCHHLKEYETRSLSELTYEMGYYDQSHFIKEFRQFSGFTPKKYFEQKNIAFTDL